MNKLHWIGFGLTVFGFLGILVSVASISCTPSDYQYKTWSERIGDRFDLVKLSDVKQLDGSFFFGTGDIKVDNKVVFAYRNKQNDIQIGSIGYDNIKIRYGKDSSSYILIEYNNSISSSDTWNCRDLQDLLVYSSRFSLSPIHYVIFCIPENGDKDFIKDWK